MTRGLHKATAYFNNIEARKDWEAILQKAGNVNVFDIAKIAPKPEAGFRRIDKAIGKLRELIEAEAQLKVIAAEVPCTAELLDTKPTLAEVVASEVERDNEWLQPVRPTYDQLIRGAKFTEAHRAEVREWWNDYYSDANVKARMEALR